MHVFFVSVKQSIIKSAQKGGFAKFSDLFDLKKLIVDKLSRESFYLFSKIIYIDYSI
tara:strand:- start:834 stop:1004 length:171 start_codon:yes stop_codon:yes gene_type:complete